MQLQSQSADCCNTCTDPIVENIPGPQGEQGEPGEDGCTGTNAYTNTTQDFVVPAVNDDVTIDVGQSAWAGIGQVVHIESAGYYEVLSRPSTTQIQVENLGYDGNAAPTTNIVAGVRVTAGGLQGPDGSIPGGALLAVNNLSDLVSASAARTNLGGTTVGANLFTQTNVAAIRYNRINADNTVSQLTDSQFRTAIGLAIGTDVQAYDALLQSLSSLGTAANKMFYTTGVNVVAEADLTAFARTLLDDADATTARATLGKLLPRYGVLARITAVDLNVATSDNAMTIEATRYRIDTVTVENPSTNVAAVTAGVFTAAGGGGTTLAADQALAALTATTKFDDLALEAVVGTDTRTEGTLYFRVGAALGSAATANVVVTGWRLD